MATTSVRGQVIFQDENALALPNKPVAAAAGKGKSSLAAPKKNGAGFGSRKALHDITNKSKLKPRASSKAKKIDEGVDFDIAKEGFLHDHSKCIAEQQNQWDSFYTEHILFHGHGTNKKEEILEFDTKDWDNKSSNTWDELEESPLDDFSDLLECSTQWRSPPHSPTRDHSSLPSSPLSWRFESVEFMLKEER